MVWAKESRAATVASDKLFQGMPAKGCEDLINNQNHRSATES